MRLHGRGSRSDEVLVALHQSAYSLVTISVHQVFEKVDRCSSNGREITKKRRTMAVLADVASIHLVLPGADIRTAAILARGKTTVDLMRLEPKV